MTLLRERERMGGGGRRKGEGRKGGEKEGERGGECQDPQRTQKKIQRKKSER